MLALTRHRDKSIILSTETGQEVIVTFLGSRGNQGRIGIKAPPEISIRREEVPPRDPGKSTKGKLRTGRPHR